MPTLSIAPQTPASALPGEATSLLPTARPAAFVAVGATAGLLVAGLLPVQLIAEPVWSVLSTAVVRTSAAHAAQPGLGIVAWYMAMWALAGATLGLSLGLPVGRRRLALLAAAGSAAIVLSSLAAHALLGHPANPALPWAVLLGGLTGRIGYMQWLVLHRRRQAMLRQQFTQTLRQAKAEFLTQLTRDLRTPLNGVLGVADLLIESAVSQDQQRHLEVFKRSAAQLSRVVDDLNELARIESGSVTLCASDFALVPFVQKQITAFKPLAEAKGVAIRLTLSSDLPQRVHGDALRTGQVLAHLIGNAVRVTRQGAVHVEVRTHSRDPQRVRFAVFDTSLHQESGKLAGIVEPFGAGGADAPAAMALTLTRRLAELLGGRLTLRRSPGKGSTVVFSLPLSAAEQPVQAPDGRAPIALADSAAAALEIHVPKVSVLLVDDNVSTRQLIESMLDPQRFSVVSCSNGREALQNLEVAPYDIVLMDLDMPQMDGWTAVRELRRLESERKAHRTPVIALGTAPFELERQRCLEAGFDQHLCKPLRKSRLLEAVLRLGTSDQSPGPAARAEPRKTALRCDQRDSLALLDGDGLIDVRAALTSLGGDAALYLDAIEHLAPALGRWPGRFQDALARRDVPRARQMVADIRGIFELVGAAQAAAAIARIAAALNLSDDAERSARCKLEIEQHLEPLIATVQAAADRVRLDRQSPARPEQGHNSAF